MKKYFLLLLYFLEACGSGDRKSFPEASTVGADPFLWLEDIQGKKPLEWVRQHNAVSARRIESDPRFEKTRKVIADILLADDRIVKTTILGDFVYVHWTDKKNPRGLWQRSPLSSYLENRPAWEVLLDIDKLGQEEGKSWTLDGTKCLGPEYELCLVALSDGGKDEISVREFNLLKKSFVKENAFVVPSAKSTFSWVDTNTIAVATDFGPGSMTTSGYPSQLRLWSRGTPLISSPKLMEIPLNEMVVDPWLSNRPEGRELLVIRRKTFNTIVVYRLNSEKKLEALNLPEDIESYGIFKGQLLFMNHHDWPAEKGGFPQGSLLSYALDQKSPVRPMMIPSKFEALVSVSPLKDEVIVNYMHNVLTQATAFRQKALGAWAARPVNMPLDGTIEFHVGDDFSNRIFAEYESFLSPMSLHFIEGRRTRRVRSTPAYFDASKYESHRLFATSRDGTKIPYFVVAKKDSLGKAPQATLLYGYGGFLIPQNPFYASYYGPTWLDRGGVLVYANIRGGGEFGPRWHQAALREKRQNAFDDFAAVAEDLIKRKITIPSKLGIRGGSNGGLLVGASITQRPELFKAALCLVPLLDMLRFNKLLAGASWMDEYGNPDKADDAAFIRKYSPYQNLQAGRKYPNVLFMTSTLDDRVHPGHARKMAAKMESLGKEILYYENIEGGHAGAADALQKSKNRAYEIVFMLQELGP